MSGSQELPSESDVPVGIRNSTWMNLKAAVNVADCEREKIGILSRKKLYGVTRRHHDFFSKHLKIQTHCSRRVVPELPNDYRFWITHRSGANAVGK
jgi:hypothetical protein